MHSSVEKEIMIEFDMASAIDDVVEKLANDKGFSDLFKSILDNFKQKIKAKDQDGMLVYALIVGYIFNDLWNSREEIIDEVTQKRLLKELIKREENLDFYECELENGDKFVLSTNNKDVVNNEMTKIIKEKTGSNPVSPLRKLSETEKKEQMKIISETIDGDKND